MPVRILEIPDLSWSFYIKKYWFKNIIGSVRLKVEELAERKNAEAQEKDGRK